MIHLQISSIIINSYRVQGSSKINKMSMKNLSVIFTPALFHDHNQAENGGEWYCDKVLEDLILQHETLFINVDNNSSRNITDSPTPSVLNLSFPVCINVGVQPSLSIRPTVLKAPASVPNIHTTTTTITNNNNNSAIVTATTATTATTSSNRTN